MQVSRDSAGLLSLRSRGLEDRSPWVGVKALARPWSSLDTLEERLVSGFLQLLRLPVSLAPTLSKIA